MSVPNRMIGDIGASEDLGCSEFFRVVPAEGENTVNAVSVERKKGNTNQLKGEFGGENWGRRLSPLPARRKSLLLRALLQWEGWLAGGEDGRARSILFPLFRAMHRAPVGVYTLSTVLSPIEYRSLELFFAVDLTLQWLDLQPSSTVEPTDPAR